MRSMLIWTFLAVAAVPVTAQSPAFEVVSVKESPPPTPNASGGVSISLFVGARPGGKWEANNATLFMLLQRAFDGYGMPGQIVGAPPWAEKIRFHINAIAGGDPPAAEMNQMVRQMLADRFKLKVRIEQREVD